MRLPRADGTTMDQATMVVNKVRSLGVSKTITKVRGILARNHGTTKIKSHGTRTRNPIRATRNLNLKMLVSLLLKM